MEKLKRAAAYEAVERYVESGMVLGLGSGSTAFWMVSWTLAICEQYGVGYARHFSSQQRGKRCVPYLPRCYSF